MSDPSAGAAAAPAALTYAALDDHALACNGLAAGSRPLALFAGDLGPQIEHLLLAQQGVVPLPAASPLMRGVSGAVPNRLLEMGDGYVVLRLAREPLPGTEWTKLSIRAKRAAVAAGFGERVAGQLAVALEEVLANIIEHSEAAASGILAFRGSPGQFEFVAADQGIGALNSLRINPQFAGLQTARDALPLILQDGCSCTGDPDRGKGFSDLFRGLANHSGRLRFRSGDAAVVIDGRSPTAIRPKVKARAPLNGFIASVCCLPT
jgi:hypothetical protein